MTGTSLHNALSRFDKDDTTTKVQTNHVHLRHDDWYDEDDMATKVQTNHIHLTKCFICRENHELKLVRVIYFHVLLYYHYDAVFVVARSSIS